MPVFKFRRAEFSNDAAGEPDTMGPIMALLLFSVNAVRAFPK
jgi:hypothetical protein